MNCGVLLTSLLLSIRVPVVFTFSRSYKMNKSNSPIGRTEGVPAVVAVKQFVLHVIRVFFFCGRGE